MAYSFAPRLRLAPLWPALAALALAAVLASILLPRTLAQAATAQLAQGAKLIVAAVPPPAALTGPDLALQGHLRHLVAGTDFRITVVALDGTVLADSERSDLELAKMDNHRTRPEIVQALARGEGSAVRHSDTTGHDTLYAARLVHDGVGRTWILRLGQPLSAISALNRHLSRILMLAVAAALALVALVSWWLTRELFRPLGTPSRRRGHHGPRRLHRPHPHPGTARAGAPRQLACNASRATPTSSFARSRRSAITCAPRWRE